MTRLLPTRRLPLALTTATLVAVAYALAAVALSARLPEPPTPAAALAYTGWILLLALVVIFSIEVLGRLWTPLAGLLALAWGALAIVDVKVYGILGVHPYDPMVARALRNPGVSHELQLGWRTGLSLGLAAVSLAGLCAALLVWGRRLERRWPGLSGRFTAALSAGLLAVVGALSLAPKLAPKGPGDGALAALRPLADLLRGPPGLDAAQVGVRWPEVSPGAPPAHRPLIVFVVVESLRADTFASAGPLSQLRHWSERLGCLTSAHHFSGGHTTEYGVFSALYGLDAYHFDPFREHARPSAPLLALKAAGWHLDGLSASALRSWNGAGFMTEALDNYTETLTDGSYEGDAQVVSMALDRIDTSGSPRFLFLFLNATHHNYQYPPEFERFTPVMPADYDHLLGDDALAADSARIVNRYKNAVGYVDHLLDRLFRRLEPAVRRGDAVVVVTGDHGEEFWEHGLLGHAAPTFVRERIEVPLVMCGARIPHREVSLSSHVDLMPTLFDALSLAPPPMQGVALNRRPDPDRLVLVSGLGFPYWTRGLLAVRRGQKHHLELCADRPDCLVSTRVTDLRDRAIAPGGDPSALKRLMPLIRARMTRFLVFP